MIYLSSLGLELACFDGLTNRESFYDGELGVFGEDIKILGFVKMVTMSVYCYDSGIAEFLSIPAVIVPTQVPKVRTTIRRLRLEVYLGSI